MRICMEKITREINEEIRESAIDSMGVFACVCASRRANPVNREYFPSAIDLKEILLYSYIFIYRTRVLLRVLRFSAQ